MAVWHQRTIYIQRTTAEEREDHEVFSLGDFLLLSGRTIRNAKLAYK